MVERCAVGVQRRSDRNSRGGWDRRLAYVAVVGKIAIARSSRCDYLYLNRCACDGGAMGLDVSSCTGTVSKEGDAT